jgi:ABC-type polysaccharide/polyol phosphate transport system ATPase subunit
LKNHKVEIFEFAELTGFENMPLKFYSSGMVLRLAFSIAMHAVGDIYIFDEIFAVGDEGFQKKCKDSFELLLDAKKTIVLISHDFSFLKKYVTQLLVLSPRDIFQISGRDRIAEYENAEDLLADFESGKLPAFNGPP